MIVPKAENPEPRGTRSSHGLKPEYAKSSMIKQAGRWEKGLLEAVQNSQDGFREKWGIDVIRAKMETAEDAELFKEGPDGGPGLKVDFIIPEFDKHTLLIIDNGRGLYSDELDRWTDFGPSWKATEEAVAGEMGLGRGQTIAMLYDYEKEKLAGSVEVYTNDLWIEEFIDCDVPQPWYRHDRIGPGDKGTLNKYGVPYSCSEEMMEETGECHPRVKGFTWKLTKSEDKDPWDFRKVEDGLKDSVFPRAPFEVRLNEEPIWEEEEKEEDEVIRKKDYEIHIRDRSGNFATYNDYRFIRNYSGSNEFSIDGLSGYVEIHKHLSQDQSREDFNPTEEKKEVFEKIEGDIFNYAWSKAKSDPDSLTQAQVRGIITYIHEKDLEEEYGDVKFIPDIRESMHSLNKLAELSKRNLLLTTDDPNSAWADASYEFGKVVIANKLVNWEFEGSIDDLGGASKLLKQVTESDVPPPTYEDIPPEKMTDSQRKFIRFWEEILGKHSITKRKLKIGKSPFRLGWTDGISFIAIEEGHIPEEAVEEGDWREVFEKTVETMAHEISHHSNDMQKVRHKKELYERAMRIMGRLIRRFNELFPEYTVPEDFAEKMNRKIEIEYTPDPSELHEKVKSVETRIEEYPRWPDAHDEDSEFACLYIANGYRDAERMRRILREEDKVPEDVGKRMGPLEGELHSKKVIKRDKICSSFFKGGVDPTILPSLGAGEHRNIEDMETLTSVRPDYCDEKYGKEIKLPMTEDTAKDRLKCYYARETKLYEKARAEGIDGKKLYESCIKPIEKTAEEEYDLSKENLGGAREEYEWCTISLEG